ncbi:MAG: ABC transporter permease [Fimbriimonadales bacterium]|nr:ABC transporter permease [Fimbriimonadales bacterium]
MAHLKAFRPPSLKDVVLSALTFIGEVTILLVETVRRLFRRPLEIREILNQMAFVGITSVPIVALTSMASGGVLALYLAPLLGQAGVPQLLGGTVGLSVTRELAPVIAGIMVAARCGSAMAAQIGTMAVTEQIDALRSLSVHPYNYLVVPRVLAASLMLPILGLIAVFFGLGGGVLVAHLHNVPPKMFLDSVRIYVESWDFEGGLWKTFFFGLIISLVSCQQGLRTTGGAVGVGRATTNAVVLSTVLIYVTNYLLADLFY